MPIQNKSIPAVKTLRTIGAKTPEEIYFQFLDIAGRENKTPSELLRELIDKRLNESLPVHARISAVSADKIKITPVGDPLTAMPAKPVCDEKNEAGNENFWRFVLKQQKKMPKHQTAAMEIFTFVFLISALLIKK